MLAKAGVLIAVSDVFGVTGRQRLAKVPLGPAYAQRIRSLLELIDILDGHEARFAAMIAERLETHRGYQAIQQEKLALSTKEIDPRDMTPFKPMSKNREATASK